MDQLLSVLLGFYVSLLQRPNPYRVFRRPFLSVGEWAIFSLSERLPSSLTFPPADLRDARTLYEVCDAALGLAHSLRGKLVATGRLLRAQSRSHRILCCLPSGLQLRPRVVQRRVTD